MDEDNVTFLPTLKEQKQPPAPLARPPRATKIKTEQLDKARARRRVIELAAAGLTNEQIAEHMREIGAKHGKTERAVETIMNYQLRKWAEQNSDNLATYREKKLFELEQLKRAVWADALAGDVEAVRQAAAIIKTQTDMSGAAAAKRHQHEVTVTAVDEQEIRAMEQAWVNAAPPVELPPGEEIVDAEVVDERRQDV